jgi:hypothetical protein
VRPRADRTGPVPRRVTRGLALAASIVAAAACATPRVAPPAFPDAPLVVLGDLVLPASNVAGGPRADVGGISGAYFDRQSNRLYGIVDDRLRPRVLGFEIALSPAVTLVRRELVELERPAAGRTLDAEGIAPAPNGHWYISSEGDVRGQSNPVAGIHEYTRDGRFVRSLPLPDAFVDGSGNTPRGMRLNLSLEALGASPDGRWIFAGLESSLLQDGPAANVARGAVVRLLAYDLRAPAAPPREYAYLTDTMPRPPDWTPTDGDAGVVDLLALSRTDLLVLERGYVVEDPTPTSRRANAIRIYRVRLDRSAEVTGRQSLAEPPPARPLEKRLVLDLATVAPRLHERLRRLENFEAIAFGPPLPDGRPTLLLVSDDNFSSTQVTEVVAFRWEPAP